MQGLPGSRPLCPGKSGENLCLKFIEFRKFFVPLRSVKGENIYMRCRE